MIESAYRYLIARALREKDPKLAGQLTDWAYLKYDLDLTPEKILA